jgi:hypothetical protein
METVVLSLWLPISRPNFYARRADTWVQRRGNLIRSSFLDLPEYRAANPMLLVDVLRRVIEVLPESFGYGEWGVATTRNENVGDEVDMAKQRITSVTMTLDLSSERASAGPTQRRANAALIEARVARVDAYVNENGYYTFTAAGSADRKATREALRRHIGEVFGGSYYVHPIEAGAGGRRDNRGSASLKRYNGNEIQVHKTANERKFTLIQCRIFGESPRELATATVENLLTHVLLDAASFCDDPGDIDAHKRVEAAFPPQLATA